MNYNKKFMVWSLSVILLVLCLSFNVSANLVDSNIKSAIKIVQLHAQMDVILKKYFKEKEKFINKIVSLKLPSDVKKELDEKLKSTQKEVNFLCENLKSNQIRPEIILSVVGILKNNVQHTFHIYPFLNCLKTYMVQNQLPKTVKDAVINFVKEDYTGTYGKIDFKISKGWGDDDYWHSPNGCLTTAIAVGATAFCVYMGNEIVQAAGNFFNW